MSDAPPGAGADGRLDRTRLTISAGPLVGPVLGRLFAIEAARVGLPVDRVNEALLIADALAARAPALSADGRLSVSVRATPGRIEARIGPLRPGGGRTLLDAATIPGAGGIVERLADDVRIKSSSTGDDVLVLRLAV